MNESLGVPDDISNFISQKIDPKIDEILKIQIDQILYFKIDSDNIKADIKIFFHFKKNNIDRYSGNINYKESVESKFKNVKIIINILSENPDKYRILESIQHEMTHLYDLYHIKDFLHETKWRKTTNLIDSNRQDRISLFAYFRNLYYLSLPHEINARVSAVQQRLYKLNIVDTKILIEEIKKTNSWKNLINFKDFDPKKYTNDLINLLGLKFVIYLINEFNSFMGIKTKIKGYEDIFKYFKKFKWFLNDISKKYESKLFKIISKFSESIDEYYCNDDKIIKYENFLEREEILPIFNNYF